MATSNGVTYGLLFDAGLATTNSTRADYEAASQLNSDADAFLDWQEYVAGTSPTDSASIPWVSMTNSTELIWNFADNRLYSVLISTNLSEGFELFTNGLETASCTVPTNPPAAFFRVEVSVK